MNSTWENIDFFEKIVAEYAGSRYAVATDSCTNSIFLCLKYLESINIEKIPVRVPVCTYPSIPMAVNHAGFEVDFRNVKWEGIYKLDPYPIYDGAVRFTKDMYEGGLHCLSFHIKKHIPIGRGGMILTDDKLAVEWLRRARYDGRHSPFWKDVRDIKFFGWHMYMTPDQAAKGIELFYRLDEVNRDLATWKDYDIDLSSLEAFK